MELTKKMIEAPRMFLLGTDLGYNTLETMRVHLDDWGGDYSCWPDWAQTGTGYLTKAKRAILIYTMMQAAAEKEQA